MKNILFKILSLVLVLVVSVTAFVGCSKRQNDISSNTPTITDYYIVKDGFSDYKIVTAQEPTTLEEHAANELSDYLYEATKVKLKIVKDNEVSDSNKLISIGYNSIQNSKVSIDKKAVGNDGFIIKTVDDDLFLVGGASYGTLYAVYEVLEYLIDFKIYSSDEIKIVKNEKVPLYDFNLTVKPSFATRLLNTATFNAPGDVFDAAKLRLIAFDHSGGRKGLHLTDEGKVSALWGCWAHTLGAKFLPWDKYYADHPEWFEGVENNYNYQIMMSNPDVISEVAKNLKSLMDNQKESTNFMVGINDNTKAHSGDQALADANGGYGGVYVLFLNALDEKISQWYKEEGVERDYKIVGLAYGKYIDAPVDENLNPVNENVIANENVAIMYAPISMDWSKPITDKSSETNNKLEKAMSGWANVCKEMMVWTYSISFGQYLLDFDNYHTFRDNYRFYEDIGVTFIYDQAAGQTAIPFNALRDYVQSSLMWDASRNTNDLIEDFIDNYYKVAAPYIKEFFYSIRSHYKMFMDNGIIDTLHCGNSPTNREMFMKGWSFKFCQESMEYINKAYQAVEQSSFSQEVKDKLIKRIKLDSIMPRYIMLDKFANSMLPRDYKALLDEFEIDIDILEITSYRETFTGRSIDDFITSCRGKI